MITEQKFEHLFETFWDKYLTSKMSTQEASIYHLLLKFAIDNNSLSFNIDFTGIKTFLRISNEKILASIVSLNNKGFLTYKTVSKGLFNITISDG